MGEDTAEHRGRPDKRRAIMRAANLVFGRDGYTRATVDAIAREAGVSKKTIYNHFDDKEALFLTGALEASREPSAEIMALFASMPERGTSVLVASHDLGLVKRMKKRVLVLDHGKLVDDISPEDLADA